MTAARDTLLGLAGAAALWILLVWSQTAWFTATHSSASRAALAGAMVALVVTGIVVGVALWVAPTVTLWVTAGSLLALLIPVTLALGSWWPEAFPGNVGQLGVHTGTHVAIGVLLAGAVARSLRREAR